MGLFQAIGSVVGGVFKAVGDVVTLKPAQAIGDVVGGISGAMGNFTGDTGINSSDSMINSLVNKISGLFSTALGRPGDLNQDSNMIPDSVKSEIADSMNGTLQKIEALFKSA